MSFEGQSRSEVVEGSLAWMVSKIAAPWNRFFFAGVDPLSFGVLRIALAGLLLIGNGVLAADLDLWFGPHGLMTSGVSQGLAGPGAFSVLGWIPQTSAALWVCFAIYNLQVLALAVGWCSRFQAACVFVWLTSFQHRNVMIFDAEDSLLRMLLFFLIFAPAGLSLGVDGWLARRRRSRPNLKLVSAWPLRLVQLQISLVYLAAGLQKLRGAEWRDGTALYYVGQLESSFGRFPLPGGMFEWMPAVKAMTWGVLVFELVIPIALWVPKTRRMALVAALVFHLATDYSMNLFLFQWIMLAGLLAFVAPAEIRSFGRRLSRVMIGLGHRLRLWQKLSFQDVAKADVRGVGNQARVHEHKL